MKKLFLIASVAIFSFAAQAQPPKGPVNKGDAFGESIKVDEPIGIAAIGKIMGDAEIKPMKITGKVTEVCSKKGCWMKVVGEDNTEVFVKFKDYGFFVPMEMVGHTIVMDGDAKVKTVSVEELQHYAEDAKKSKEEIEAIKEPKKEIRYIASGVKVID